MKTPAVHFTFSIPYSVFRIEIFSDRITPWPALAAAVLFSAVVAAASAQESARPSPAVDGFNLVLGTQTFGVKYQFTQETRLVETARRIEEMGGGLIKFSLDPRYCESMYGLPKRGDVHSLTDLARNEPSFRAVFDMPFAHYLLWVEGFSPIDWHDGLSQAERDAVYRETNDLVRYLLTHYQNSGKTFYLGQWEGDWLLRPGYDLQKDPTPEAIQGMIDWLKARQEAIDDARGDAHASGVQVYHYTEVNLVQLAVCGRQCLTNDVLPHVPVDFVSYSAYDTVLPNRDKIRDALFQSLDYIQSKLPPKPGLPSRRVFIGEYGFPLDLVKTAAQQDRYARDVCRAGLEWGCPFVLYWEMYCNELRDGKHRGFWLIDDENRKQPFYFTLESYYARMRSYLAAFRRQQGRDPTPDEFRKEALNTLGH
jgi:hypothetical protein